MKIASTFLLTLLLGVLSVCLIGGALWIYPVWVKDTFNLGPVSATGIVIICLLLMLAALIIGWVLETVFTKNGEKLGKLDVAASGQQATASQPEAKHTDADTSRFVAEALVDHLRLRYRRRWKAKVRMLLVQGKPEVTSVLNEWQKMPTSKVFPPCAQRSMVIKALNKSRELGSLSPADRKVYALYYLNGGRQELESDALKAALPKVLNGTRSLAEVLVIESIIAAANRAQQAEDANVGNCD